MSFLDNLSLRKSCYSCKFPSSHNSDITMLDYWDIKDDDDKGVSAIIINTQKGIFLFDTIKKNARINQIEISKKSSIFTNHDRIPSYFCRIKKRKQFFLDWNNNKYDFFSKKYKYHKNLKEVFYILLYKFLSKVKNIF